MSEKVTRSPKKTQDPQLDESKPKKLLDQSSEQLRIRHS